MGGGIGNQFGGIDIEKVGPKYRNFLGRAAENSNVGEYINWAIGKCSAIKLN